MSKGKDQRKRLAAFRAIAPLAVPPRPASDRQPVDVEEAADQPEDLPQASRASHFS